jgi:transcriptional regulator with GAF, ATPase, and Fis domain
MNTLEFFQGATLRICGSLDIEQALWKLLLFVRKAIPADRAVLRHHPPGENVVVQIARAELDRGYLEDLVIPLPSQVSSAIENQSTGNAVLIPEVEGHPIARHTSHPGRPLGEAVIAGPLSVEGLSIGALLLGADQPGVLTRPHADLLSHILQPCAVALSNSLRYRDLLELKERLDEDYRALQEEIRQEAGEEIVGADFGLKAVMDAVRLVAPTQSPVLLLGPTGSGKELIANSIHSLSKRRGEPFVKVNCGAIPETLMDSELFGYEKGAFTGAVKRKRGRFERAHEGTIFLDEVAELSPSAQTRLLRVLQNGEIERVGGTETLDVDIRIIAATHRDLSKMAEDGSFRSDLYYRLNVFPVDVPSLAQRKADIPALVYHFIRKKTPLLGLAGVPKVETRAMERLMAYDWPGNVRELENAVERSLILCRGNPMTFKDIGPARTLGGSDDADGSTDAFESLDDTVRRQIGRALTRANGRVAGAEGAAELLKIHPQTLRHRMKKLGIPFGRHGRGGR